MYRRYIRPKYSCYFNTFITQKFSKSKFIWFLLSVRAGCQPEVLEG